MQPAKTYYAMIAGILVLVMAGCAQPPAEKPAEKPQVSEKPAGQPPVAEQPPAPEPPENLFAKTPELTFRATRVGKASSNAMSEASLVISPDSKRWAAVAMTADRKAFVICDGESGKEYDSIEGDIIFSPDSKRVGYYAKKAGRPVIVIDGVETPENGTMAWLQFGADSQHLAYCMWQDTGRQVTRDGVKEKLYADLAAAGVYSPDGAHLAYAASMDAARWHAVLDGVEQATYDAINLITFSPDSKHLAYAAFDGQWHVVLDGKLLKAYGSISGITFSPDSATLIYLARTDAGDMLVMGETEMPQYKSLPVYSPDGKHWANIAEENGQKCVVRDDKPGAKYEDVKVLTFSPDSQHLAYVALVKDKGWVVVRDGAEGSPCQVLNDRSLQFSPDSRHLACVAVQGGQMDRVEQWVDLDGVAGKKYMVILNPRRGPVAGRIDGPYFSFSPDSRHIAYCAQGPEGGYYIAVDGSEIATPAPLWGNMRFDKPGTIHGVMLRGSEIYTVEITYTEQ